MVILVEWERDEIHNYEWYEGDSVVVGHAILASTALREVLEKRQAFIDRVGADHWANVGGRMTGVTFEGDQPPYDWRRLEMTIDDEPRQVWAPDRRYLSGKALANEIKRLNDDSLDQFAATFGKPTTVKGSRPGVMRRIKPCYLLVDDKVYLAIPKGSARSEHVHTLAPVTAGTILDLLDA